MAVWTIHETDLYHPHQDPDDHWDLACQFALAKLGHISLEGVMLDCPEHFGFGDPAVGAVAQLNWITGMSVPVGVGMPAGGGRDAPEARGGVNLLKRTLERATERVTLHIVGSCRDVAAAGREFPELFREKVRAVYLNAGSAMNTEDVEYNVLLDPESYGALFSLPCPVYWMPCFHTMNPALPAGADKALERYYGTYYVFRQGDILPALSPTVRNYLIYMLGRSADHQWLKALRAPVNREAAEYFGDLPRSMWCTGGFLHAAGLKATCNGDVVALDAVAEAPYEFVPVRIACDAKGAVSWSLSDESTGRWIFCVNKPEIYAFALSRAMKSLLQCL